MWQIVSVFEQTAVLMDDFLTKWKDKKKRFKSHPLSTLFYRYRGVIQITLNFCLQICMLIIVKIAFFESIYLYRWLTTFDFWLFFVNLMILAPLLLGSYYTYQSFKYIAMYLKTGTYNRNLRVATIVFH